MEVIKLNLIPNGTSPVAHASQYDEGRRFRCDLFEGAEVYTLDGTEVLECDIKKPDGNIVTVVVPNTSDSYIVVETTQQMCACAGNSFGEIRITKDSKDIGTLNFILAVERSPLEGGIESDSGIHNLQEQIYEAVADQYDADSVIFDDEPTEGHETGYAVKSGGLKAYIPKVIEALDDVEIDSPDEDEILAYDGVKWKNVANPASTTNFGEPYDENTTYNVPSLVIENGLLYELNEGEVDVTGPFDPTKWTQTNVAEISIETATTIRNIVDVIYPVGSVYLSVTEDTAAKVQAKFGGTWVAFGAGRTLVGFNSTESEFNEIEKTGGSKTVTLTKEQSGLPAHGHGFTQPTVSGGAVTAGITGGSHSHVMRMDNNQFIALQSASGYRLPYGTTDATGYTVKSSEHTHNLPSHNHTVTGGAVANNTGANASQAHNNLQPYVTVYMYKRTA